MKQIFALTLLLATAACASLTHENIRPKSNEFILSFDYAARQGQSHETCEFAILWNGVQLQEIYPQDDNIHTFTRKVKGRVGENIINFAGTGPSDGYGMTITNVRLKRNTKRRSRNLVVNGEFTHPNVGNGWKILGSAPGWNADGNGIEIGYGPIYNKRWPAGTHVSELDANKNVDIYQSIFLDKYYNVV